MIRINNILDAERYLSDVGLAIFDLDDTLYPERAYVKSGFNAVGAAMPDKCGISEELWRNFLSGKKAFDECFPDAAEKEKALGIYRNHEPEIELYDGVRDMLNDIRSSGKKLGMITDGRPEGQRAKIRSLGIAELFDCIIITDELGGAQFRKPCETAFVMMAEHFSVPFDKAAYVGDNENKDFISPEALGMKSIYFDNPDGLYSR